MPKPNLSTRLAARKRRYQANLMLAGFALVGLAGFAWGISRAFVQ